ncbi:NADH-quinone oxidoreductase subunit J [Rhodoplanes serenus]|uniref:NADH-quinone oxidoreductase subunit J n=1 Tax=Rhodoplanes serenus TaxID=200615 RepID=A0A9X4XNI3_9BRAD|nr:proton-conducting transporter membrane subunit [Rhodoplanes serenus]MTW18402.1 NADH-quinone oxidoreductase subunit J [Rhodoplanes serenus]
MAVPVSGPGSTEGGALLVLAIVIPVAAALLGFAAGGRRTERIALGALPIGLTVAVLIAAAVPPASAVPLTDGVLTYLLGGWAPPLGVALRADGLSAVMLVIAAVVVCAVGVFARADFAIADGAAETRAPFAFWILLPMIWAGLNTVFLAGDLFTLYVALEILTFAAVPLVCLDGRGETLQAALRYLLFALLGSVLYLAGTVLLYGAYGTLDIVLLSQRVAVAPAPLVAGALMTVGLLAKTALVPLHLWLPPAHAGAPPAGSALLSALVVKGSFFIVVRLWFDVMPGLPSVAATQMLSTLGAAAIVLGSVVALRQERLKLLIAYSTLAQIGYLFLLFGLAFDVDSAAMQKGDALAGGMLQAMSHATAKAAMFMAAGSIYVAMGHDRIAALAGAGRRVPVAVLAFALGGVALAGLPPGGAYLAKELLLGAAARTGQWWWAVVIQAGGAFTGAYLLLVLARVLAPPDRAAAGDVDTHHGRVAWYPQAAALVLAMVSLSLGLVDWSAWLPIPPGARLAASVVDTLAAAVWPVLAGGVLAVLIGRWTTPSGGRLARAVATLGPLRRGGIALGENVCRGDAFLRRWPMAGVSLLALAVAFGAALWTGR